MGIVDAPPLIILNTKDKQPTGDLIKRLTALFASIDQPIKYVPVSIARLHKDLINGDIHGFPLFFSDSNKNNSPYELSNVFYKLPIYLWCSPSTCNSPIDTHSILQKPLLTIGVRKNAKYGHSVNVILEKYRKSTYYSNSDHTLLGLLAAGKIDVMFSNAIFVTEFMKSKSITVHRSNKPFYTSRYRIGFSETLQNKNLISKINQAITQANALH
jgi:hypothetical protein